LDESFFIAGLNPAMKKKSKFFGIPMEIRKLRGRGQDSPGRIPAGMILPLSAHLLTKLQLYPHINGRAIFKSRLCYACTSG
jgi:hypothetical protein